NGAAAESAVHTDAVLAASSYAKEYIDASRARIDTQLAAYKRLSTDRGKGKEAFEREFFNNLVVVLEASFVHRTRALEGKDGNPLNEVRMLAASILRNDGVLAADKTIRYRPQSAVLGLEPGDEIRLDARGFTKLADAFFAELRARFS